MPRSLGVMNFPDFRGFTRRLILWNVGIFFALLLLGVAARPFANSLTVLLALIPSAVLHGYVWQLLTYSFLHQGILNTAFEMLSLWFLGSFLEANHGSRWLAEIYFVSVAGAGLAAIALSFAAHYDVVLTGAFGGIFGLLIAFGVLYGDMEFMLFPLPMTMKAKYLVAVYMLISIAMLFGAQRLYAFAELGGALAGFLYIRMAPRRGFLSSTSERYFGLRNNYYRWKRRRAAKKFEVYMRKQGRDVRFDSEGKYIDPDKDPNDRRWMN
ncbi:MAG: rhomboid family intramembrane serine protease [Acidobacteria bacterium]|nr:rhomboid family intramembrane serine protease [Acidobacteriota bacterium]MBW4044491.1 rhomboid family intramembrane serine protease [Acidobacteriota bacterium]